MRLQVLELPGGSFTLIFDEVETESVATVNRNSADLKLATGAKSVVVFTGRVELVGPPKPAVPTVPVKVRLSADVEAFAKRICDGIVRGGGTLAPATTS